MSPVMLLGSEESGIVFGSVLVPTCPPQIKIIDYLNP